METYKRLGILIVATAALGAGVVGAAPAPAAEAKTYKKPGSVTRTEARKVARALDRQKCLTLKETKKIVKGAGYDVTDDEGEPGWVDRDWKPAKGVESFGVSYFKGCAAVGAYTFTNGKFVIFGDLSKAALFD